MDWYNSLSISLAYSWVYFLISIILILAYTIFAYRITLPPINNLKKSVLIGLRSISLLLILILLFDPVIKITTPKEILPKTLVLIDNSKSISEYAGKEEIVKIKNLLPKISDNTEGNAEYYLFGSGNLSEFKLGSDSLEFNESSTDLSFLHEKIAQEKDLASVLLISDGIINQGANPLPELKNAQVPIYTLGIGDTSTNVDLSVEKIIANTTIYSERETEIEIILKHNNLDNKSSKLTVFDNDSLIYSESVILSTTGIERVRIPYKSTIVGNHRISVKVDTSELEKNNSNNSKVALIEVLSTKKAVTLISGSPSPDYSAIKQSIELNEDYKIYEIVELGSDKFVDGKNDIDSLNKSDIIFLIGFPTSSTSESLLDRIMSEISSKSIPVLISFSQSIDINRFADYKEFLPFDFLIRSNQYFESEVAAQKSFNNLLGSNDEILSVWNNMPPVNLQNIEITSLPATEVLLSSKVNNEPVIFVNGTGKFKSIVVTASNVWKWKLKAPKKEYNLFNNFILNSLKWLSLQSSDYFSVSLEDNSFSSGEVIKFTANLYNTIFEPLNNERIILSLDNKSSNGDYLFSPIGNGLYELDLTVGNPGIYNYSVKVENFPEDYTTISGAFNVDPMEIEFLDRELNRNFLESISVATGGEYFTSNKRESLINKLNFNYTNKIYLIYVDKELRLSSFEIILLIIVLLLSIEWVIRKFYKMI